MGPDFVERTEAEVSPGLERRQALLLQLLQGQRETLDAGVMMLAAATAAGQHLQADRTGFFAVQDNRLKFAEGWSAGRLPLSTKAVPVEWFGSPYLENLRAGRTLHLGNVASDPSTAGSRFAEIRVASLILAPILRNGEWQAGFYIHQAEPRVWADEEVSFVTDVANLTWDAVERARTVQALRESEARFRFLARLDDSTRPLTEALAITQAAAALLGEHLQVNRCAYADVEPDQDTFNLTGDYNRGVQSIVGRYTFAQFGAECLRLMREGKPYIVTDAETDGRLAEVLASYRLTQIRSVVCVPLLKAGRFVAAMAVHQTTPREWQADEVELVQLVANRCWESIERVHVSRRLRDSERRLRLSQKAGRIGSFEWLMQENRVVWSPEEEMLFGLPEGTFEGYLEGWSSRVVPEDAERVLISITECVRQKSAECGYEFRAIMPDGTLRWLRGQGQFFYDENGVAERMVGVNIDIDEQKRAAADLYQQWRTFDAVLSHTPDLLYTFDSDCRFTYANRAVLDLLQMPREEVLGRNLVELNYPSPTAKQLQRQVRQVFETGETITDYTTLQNRAGEPRDYEYIFVPVLDSESRVYAVACSSRDITDRKLAEERERERQRQLRESARLESLGVMAGGVAHDFNNLLTGILGNASLLADSNIEEDRSIAGQIVLAAERAAGLTRQMLAFSGKGRFEIEVLDLNAIVRENLILLHASLARNVSVDLKLGGQQFLMEADRAQVQQVVMNLLMNASEAIGDRPGRVSIRTGWSERAESKFSTSLQAMVAPGKYIVLEVTDDGSGMTPETLQKIFDPFFTTKFTGRGLGLAAVLGIVKGHHGDIEVITKPGAGTSFRIFFPPSGSPGIAAAAERPAAAPVPAGRTVLVVDDEEVVRKVASATLRRCGFRVVTAADGIEAVDALRRDREISLVILDLTMPRMTGEQALPQLKAIDPAVPILLSSGYSEAELSPRFAGAGLSGFLQKPYSAEAISRKVSEVLLDSF